MAEQDTTANAGKASAFQATPGVRHGRPLALADIESATSTNRPMYFLNQEFARDEQATAGSAVVFASAELVEVASAATKVRGFGEFGEEDASPAASVRGCETRNPAANQTLEGTPGKRPFLRRSLVPGVPHL